jgi:IS30 family transposase
MKHFTLSSRKMLAELLQQGEKYREIKKVIGIGISSISDEIKRNSVDGKYDPYIAQTKAMERHTEKSKRTKLEISEGLKQFVIAKIREDWSPEQVAGELRNLAGGKTVISHETVYRFIYSEEGKREGLWKHLRHRKKPERVSWGTRKKRRVPIPDRVSIHKRPEHINDREEFGHWEGDLMVFSETRSVLAVFVERMTRKVVAVVNENKTASEMEMALHELITSAGQTNVLSVTFDNGTENVCHQKVREDYGSCFKTYFCDPYSSWQKGAVENMNKLLRQYFPRNISAENLTQDRVDEIVQKLNSRPRKCIGYQKPSEKFRSCSV